MDAAGTKNVARWSSMYLMLGLSPPRQASPVLPRMQMSGPTLGTRGMPFLFALPTCAAHGTFPHSIPTTSSIGRDHESLPPYLVQPPAPAFPSAALPASASSAAAASAAALALAAPALPTTTLALATAAIATSPQPPAALAFAAAAIAVPATSASATALLGKQGCASFCCSSVLSCVTPYCLPASAVLLLTPLNPALPAECSDNGLWTQVRAQYQAYNDAYTTATSLEWQIEFNNRTTNETLVSAPAASAAAPSGRNVPWRCHQHSIVVPFAAQAWASVYAASHTACVRSSAAALHPALVHQAHCTPRSGQP